MIGHRENSPEVVRGVAPFDRIVITTHESAIRIISKVGPLPMPPTKAQIKQEQQLVIGIRPETLYLDESGQLEAVCEVAELTGPELIVTAQAGSQRLMACLPPRTAIAEGEMLKLGFDAGSLQLFDRATGLRCA